MKSKNFFKNIISSGCIHHVCLPASLLTGYVNYISQLIFLLSERDTGISLANSYQPYPPFLRICTSYLHLFSSDSQLCAFCSFHFSTASYPSYCDARFPSCLLAKATTKAHQVVEQHVGEEIRL